MLSKANIITTRLKELPDLRIEGTLNKTKERIRFVRLVRRATSLSGAPAATREGDWYAAPAVSTEAAAASPWKYFRLLSFCELLSSGTKLVIGSS